MEGTVTISLKDYEELVDKKEKLANKFNTLLRFLEDNIINVDLKSRIADVINGKL